MEPAPLWKPQAKEQYLDGEARRKSLFTAERGGRRQIQGFG
jgi:hypothetical protein